jgi:hypothetical protein
MCLVKFKNFWPEHPGFLETVKQSWESTKITSSNPATIHADKFKALRYSLKKWSRTLSNLTSLMENCNKVIFFLDSLEDCRSLNNPERNLRNIIKIKFLQLLRYKSIYWKKRHTVNRVKLGDECTKYYHAMATMSFRKNSIAQLTDAAGNPVHDHEGKAALIWTSFRNRMGVTSSPIMHFDLAAMVRTHQNLSSLVLPIKREEIDKVIKHMPLDKAPGPDGFNGMFMKKCWDTVKEDFYRLCEGFFEGRISLEAINSSFITLVPKISNPESVNDFRPISLLNISIKILTKILVDRLQLVILELIHVKQYGFIRHRTIQDCLAWSFKYIHHCHQSKREVIILKLDFAKAFDTIEHSTIIQMMQQLGFLEK